MLGAAVALATALLAPDAHAYCRTTTCDPNNPKHKCEIDSKKCVQTGFPLFWRGRCISFGVDSEGSPLRKISRSEALATISQSYRAWINQDCDPAEPDVQAPSLQLFLHEDPILCDEQQYNQNDGNANAWIFSDKSWPHPAGAHQLALTTLTYNVEDGEIFDVDVEINTFQNEITVGDGQIKGDLLSIATHEAGHFFGLSHTTVARATMTNSYAFGDTQLRSLEADDIAGICETYPPTRGTPPCDVTRIPRHGFSPECGVDKEDEKGCCTTAPGRPGASGARAIGATLAAVALLWSRRRRQSRSAS
jgi:hypothetical protein